MRVLLGCVNSAVSLVGYDLAAGQPFWYCPGDVLRVCGICVHKGRLWTASDNLLASLGEDGVRYFSLPGPHENLAHSVKPLGDDLLGVADTGNSRILLRAGEGDFMTFSPLEGWGMSIPPDAIHLNDMILWEEGLLASAFSYQPFVEWKRSDVAWKREGWGILFYLRREKGKTLSRILASGLDCPHSLTVHDGCVYCCSSARGEFYCFKADARGLLREVNRWKVTDTHFLRGCLRVDGGWILGGSSARHSRDAGGMVLFRLDDAGHVETLSVAGVGEIYDIIPWDASVMPKVADTLLSMPGLGLEGEFPPRCSLPSVHEHR